MIDVAKPAALSHRPVYVRSLQGKSHCAVTTEAVGILCARSGRQRYGKQPAKPKTIRMPHSFPSCLMAGLCRRTDSGFARST